MVSRLISGLKYKPEPFVSPMFALNGLWLVAFPHFLGGSLVFTDDGQASFLFILGCAFPKYVRSLHR